MYLFILETSVFITIMIFFKNIHRLFSCELELKQRSEELDLKLDALRFLSREHLGCNISASLWDPNVCELAGQGVYGFERICPVSTNF